LLISTTHCATYTPHTSTYREIEQTQPFEDTAARCLAFGGDIHYSLWTDLCSNPDRLYLVLQASKKAVARIAALVNSVPDSPAANSNGYLGYDERDRVDYDNEGYEDTNKAHLEEQKAAIQDKIDEWFLMLHQIYAQPVPQLNKKIIASRARKNSRYSSRRMAKLKDTPSTESAAETSCVSEIDTMDLVVYFTDLVGVLLGLLGRHRLNENAHNMCVKVVACLNSQMPRLQHADTNEVRLLCICLVRRSCTLFCAMSEQGNSLLVVLYISAIRTYNPQFDVYNPFCTHLCAFHHTLVIIRTGGGGLRGGGQRRDRGEPLSGK